MDLAWLKLGSFGVFGVGALVDLWTGMLALPGPVLDIPVATLTGCNEARYPLTGFKVRPVT